MIFIIEFSEGYTFHGDVNKVFKEFFGENNPFAGLSPLNLNELLILPLSLSLSISLSLCPDFFHLENNTDIDGHVTFGGLKGRAQPKQDPPVERDLLLTLEEVYNGCTKKMKISRKVSIMLTLLSY